MSELLESGDLQHHINHILQPTYARRYHNMITAIEQCLLPLGVTLPQPDRDVVGGYFIWLSLPAPLKADEVATRAKEEENLIIGQGSLFAVHGDQIAGALERDIRLCFSWEEENSLAEGIARLGKLIHEMQDGVRSPATADLSRGKTLNTMKDLC